MIVLDIQCPECDRTETVEKIGIGRYRCRACDLTFSRDDIDVPE